MSDIYQGINESIEQVLDRLARPKLVRCEDCGKPYRDFSLDVVLSDEQWRLITGYKDGAGILCGGCIVARGAKLKIFTVAKLEFS